MAGRTDGQNVIVLGKAERMTESVARSSVAWADDALQQKVGRAWQYCGWNSTRKAGHQAIGGPERRLVSQRTVGRKVGSGQWKEVFHIGSKDKDAADPGAMDAVGVWPASTGSGREMGGTHCDGVVDCRDGEAKL
jgi:hypothetical protein